MVEVLDTEILGHRHPFTGIHFKFTDRFDDFFKVGTAPYKADYGTKKCFDRSKYNRIISQLPLHQIEYFRSNLCISQYIDVDELSNLKTIRIVGVTINAVHLSVEQLLDTSYRLENRDFPKPGNMTPNFRQNTHLIKNIILYSFDEPRNYHATLIANTSACPIGKHLFDFIIDLMQDQSSTLKTIQLSNVFLEYVLSSAMRPITSIRTIVIRKCTKSMKIKAIKKFPNAKFVRKSSFLFNYLFKFKI